jgi:hypothetical protein
LLINLFCNFSLYGVIHFPMVALPPDSVLPHKLVLSPQL